MNFNKYYDAFDRLPMYANVECIWYPAPGSPDSEEKVLAARAKEKIRKSYSQLEEVNYKFNSHGFRTREFGKAESPDILILGCSFTEGLGIKNEHVWTNVLAEKTNADIISIGRSGATMETMSRYAHIAISEFQMRPKIIYALFPEILRQEGFSMDLDFSDFIYRFYTAGSWMNQFENFDKAWQQFMLTRNVKNRFYALIQNIISIQALAHSINAKFIWDTWSAFTDISFVKNKRLPADISNNVHPNHGIDSFNIIRNIMPEYVTQDMLSDSVTWLLEDAQLDTKYRIHDIQIARDFHHPGPNTHYYYADEVYKKIINII